MTYDILTSQIEGCLWQVDVVVKDNDTTILAGRTNVACEIEQDAHNYAETIFISDLRRNFKQISELVLSWEVHGDVEGE